MVSKWGARAASPWGVSVSREGTKWSGPPQKDGPWLICGTGTQPASFRHNDLLAGRLASSRPVAWPGRAERRRPPLRQSHKFALSGFYSLTRELGMASGREQVWQ